MHTVSLCELKRIREDIYTGICVLSSASLSDLEYILELLAEL